MFVSPLDPNFITLKRAAMLIAREHFGSEPDDIMEMFKHALFMHEFERKEIAVPGYENSDALNLPLLRIEAPPTQCKWFCGLSPEDQPQELFPVYAQTVAEILSERDALPGKAETWPMFNESHSAVVMDNALHDLARIPRRCLSSQGPGYSRSHSAVPPQTGGLDAGQGTYALLSFLEDIEPRRPEPVGLSPRRTAANNRIAPNAGVPGSLDGGAWWRWCESFMPPIPK